MATRIYKTPFAATGDKETLATADQPDGKVSLQAGWTPDYELPNDNANYRPVGRAEMNGVFNELTAALGEIQLNGFAKWQAIDGGWPLGAQVSNGGLTYRSLIDNNTSEPGAVGANWLAMGSGIATTAQAQALTDDLALLTPKKLADAFKGSNQNVAPVGYQKLPGGLILQWGGIASVAGGPATFTFPIAFPNAMLIRGAFSNDTGGVGIFATVVSLGAGTVNNSMGVSVWTATNARAAAGLTSWCFVLGY